MTYIEAEKAAIDAIINSATVKNAYLSGMSQAFSITTQEIEALLDKGVSIYLDKYVRKCNNKPYNTTWCLQTFWEVLLAFPTQSDHCDSLNIAREEALLSIVWLRHWATHFENVLKNCLSQTVSIELGISRMAMQIQQGTMVPYAKYQDMELFHAITAYTGTDFGICAEIIPYLFNISANLFVQQPPALKDAEPGNCNIFKSEKIDILNCECLILLGVTNGENNGMRLLLDAEVYDYAYKNRGGEGFKARNISYLNKSDNHKLKSNHHTGSPTSS